MQGSSGVPRRHQPVPFRHRCSSGRPDLIPQLRSAHPSTSCRAAPCPFWPSSRVRLALHAARRQATPHQPHPASCPGLPTPTIRSPTPPPFPNPPCRTSRSTSVSGWRGRGRRAARSPPTPVLLCWTCRARPPWTAPPSPSFVSAGLRGAQGVSLPLHARSGQRCGLDPRHACSSSAAARAARQRAPTAACRVCAQPGSVPPRLAASAQSVQEACTAPTVAPPPRHAPLCRRLCDRAGQELWRHPAAGGP